MTLNDVRVVQHRYMDLATKYGTKLEALGWHDALAAQLRLEIIASEIPPGVKVLDVGCGYGDLIPHLPPNIDYLGLDFTESFVEHAANLYPSRTFIHRDIMRYSIPCDYVVASGVLGFHSEQEAKRIISHMWELATDTLIFNVFEGSLGLGCPEYNVRDYADWIYDLTIPKWKIMADYLSRDATLVFYKNKEIMYIGEQNA